jgi:hypothetical protein
MAQFLLEKRFHNDNFPVSLSTRDMEGGGWTGLIDFAVTTTQSCFDPLESASVPMGEEL